MDLIWPKNEFVTLVTCPAPLHIVQFEKVAPSASLSLLNLIFFSPPLTISAYETLILTFTSPPLLGLDEDLPPEKNDSNGLFPPKISPNWLKISSIFIELNPD